MADGSPNTTPPQAVDQDTFAPNINKNIAPINAAALLTTTVVGFGVTATADLFGSALPAYAFVAATGAWIAALVFALALVGRDAERKHGENFLQRNLACIRSGLDRTRKNWKYAIVFALISLSAAYTGYSGFKRNAAISGMASEVSAVSETSKQIASDVTEIRLNLDSDQARLNQMGYGTSDEHAWRALSEGNVLALELMRGLGRNRFITTLVDKPNALEGLILNESADIKAALAIAQLPHSLLNQSWHIESSYTGAFKLPEEAKMLEALGFEVVRALPDSPILNRPYIEFNQNQHMPWMAEVPALLLAVWAHNEEAVLALLEAGASADAESVRSISAYVFSDRTGYGMTLKTYDLHITALSEANRLGLDRAEAALLAAGASAKSVAKLVS